MGVSTIGRIWEELRKGATPEAVAREQEGILSGMNAAFTALDRLQTAALSFEVGTAQGERQQLTAVKEPPLL